MLFFFLFKKNTAYEMRISDWISDVFSSDLVGQGLRGQRFDIAHVCSNPICAAIRIVGAHLGAIGFAGKAGRAQVRSCDTATGAVKTKHGEGLAPFPMRVLHCQWKPPWRLPQNQLTPRARPLPFPPAR